MNLTYFKTQSIKKILDDKRLSEMVKIKNRINILSGQS
jgi:hypothetical protein